MATLLASARVSQLVGIRVGQAQRIIQLAVSQQSGIGGDRRAAKLQQQTRVEIDPLSASPVGSPIPTPNRSPL
jgi:hypothetical protein